MMKRAFWIMAASMVLLAACSKEAPADRVSGTYRGTVTLQTRYQSGGEWHDTSYVSKTGNVLTISRVDDKTVGVNLHSDRWGDVVAENVKLTDLSTSVNLSGNGTHNDGSQRCDALVSGTYGDGTGSLALNAIVKDYPYSGGRYNLSFTNK